MNSSTPRRRETISLAVLIAMVLAFFTPALGKTFIFRDAFNLFYPYKATMAEELRGLSAGLWNPYETMGSSFVGELATGWFYPGNICFMALSPDAGYRLFIVGHYLMAAVFAWFWTGAFCRSAAARSLGALSYCLSGYMLSQSGMPDMLAAAAWLPGTLWLASLYLEKRRIFLALLFGASLSMPVLAGRAEGVIINGLAACAWIALGSEGTTLRERVAPAAALLGLGGVTGAALAMVQLAPSWELGRLSMKGQGFPLEIATLWSFHPGRLLEFLMSSPWGRFWPETTYSAWDITGWEGHYPWSLTMYLGLPAVIFAALALFSPPKKRSAMVLALLAAAVLFSAGKYGPLYGIAHRVVPLLAMFRYPGKYMILAALVLSGAAAFGLGRAEQLLAGAGSAARSRLVRAMAAAGALIAVVSMVLGAVSFNNGQASEAGGQLAMGALHALAVMALLAMALFAAIRFRAPRLLGWAALAAAFFDLGLANHWVPAYAASSIYSEEPRALAIMREHSEENGLGLFDEKGRAKLGEFRVLREHAEPTVWGLSSVPGGYNLERHRRWEYHTLKPNFNFMRGVEELTGYTAAATADFDRVMKTQLHIRTMMLYNVRFAIVPWQGSELDGRGARRVGSDYSYGFRVLELNRTLPRAYLVGRSIRLADPMERTELLAGHDFTSAVVLEDSPGLPDRADEADIGLIPADISSYEPERVEIAVDSPAAAYLVLSDSWFPGWEAKVNGEPADILKANFLVRAVRVPAGKSSLVFTYRPGPYMIGKWVSLAALTILVLAAGREILSALRRGHGPRESLARGEPEVGG